MGFDGIIFQNNALKIRRPKDYLGAELEMAGPYVPGVVSTNVPDTVNKIFVGGLPSYLTDDQVMELLKSFGELRSFNLVKEGGTGASKVRLHSPPFLHEVLIPLQGFAFCEYVDPAVTEVACQGLNGMELGDRFLVVQRAALGANPGKRDLLGNPIDFMMPSVPVTAASIIAASSGGDGTPTRVLQILNMVAVEELTSDEDYKDILEDIKEECGKYGNVEEVKVRCRFRACGGDLMGPPRADPEADQDRQGQGRYQGERGGQGPWQGVCPVCEGGGHDQGSQSYRRTAVWRCVSRSFWRLE